MQIHGLMKSIHGLADVKSFIPTDKPNIYLSSDMLFGNQVFYNGLVYIELFNPKAFITSDTNLIEMQNKQIEYFANQMAKFQTENKWVEIFARIEKRIGLLAYLEYFNQIPDDQKYDAFVEIYTRSEFGFEVLKDKYQDIFKYADYSEDRKIRLQTLYLEYPKNKITIFHGESFDNPVYDFCSWTLKKKTADFFAYRYSRKGKVHKRTIDIKEAIDYLTDRNEAEIFYQSNL